MKQHWIRGSRLAVGMVYLSTGLLSPVSVASAGDHAPVPRSKTDETITRPRAATLPPAVHSEAEALAALADTALFDEEPFAREEAVDRLGESGDPRALVLLELVLIDPEPAVRAAAVEAIAGIGGDAAARALAFALGDDEESVREETVYALARVGGEIAVRLLRRGQADKSESVRVAASELLDELRKGRPRPLTSSPLP